MPHDQQHHPEPGYETSVGNLSRVALESDNVFGDDGAARQLASVTGDARRGFSVSLAVAIDATTTPTGEQGGGNGAPAGPPPATDLSEHS